jgi:hypothetical protein
MDFDLRTVIHAMAHTMPLSVRSTDLAHVYVTTSTTSPGTRLPLTERLVAAVSPLRATAPPPLVQAAGFQHAFLGMYVAGGHAAALTHAL